MTLGVAQTKSGSTIQGDAAIEQSRAALTWPERCTASTRRGRWLRTLAAPMRTTTASRPGVLSGLNAAIMDTRSLGSILPEICTGRIDSQERARCRWLSSHWQEGKA